MIRQLFIDHPKHAGESYFQHMGKAWTFGSKMFVGSLACFIHGLIPGLCVHTGSETVCGLHDEMKARKDKCQDAKATESQSQTV